MDQIKALLQNKRNLEAERQYLLTQLNDHRFKDTASIESRLQYVSDLLSRIQIWMTLLSEDEAFVTQRHLIDDVDIPRVTAEYKTRWGEEFTKTERTIRSYQRRALQKIMRFEQNKPTLPICPLNNALHCSEHLLPLE